MKTNVGTTDRIIRLLIAIGAFSIYYSGKLTGTAATIVFIVGILMAFTAWFRFCPLYALLRISTHKPEADFKKLMDANAVIIDVRQPNEYIAGHIENSINIPLGQLANQAAQFSGKTVIVCCASGSRSAMAKNILSSKGIKAFNGGGWRSLSKEIS